MVSDDGRKIWIREKIGALQRDFSLADVKTQNAGLNVTGVFVVQAAADPTETTELLYQYTNETFVRGVVGWLNLAADDIDEQIEALMQHPKFCGIRAHPPQHFDADWLLSAAAVRGMTALAEKNLAIDYLVNTTQLNKLRSVCDAVPGVRAILDHGGRPYVMTGDTKEWAHNIRNLARHTNCVCKLSGLAERAGVEWNKQTLKPWIDILIDAFGPERLMFASNWPIMTLMATPHIWVDSLIDIFDDLGLPAAAQGQIFKSTALQVYQRR